MKCSQCHGYGYIDNLEGDGIRCPKCHGLGYVLSVTTIAEIKTCKNCEWAGYCTFDDNAVMCERDGSEYITANKVQEVAEKCIDYRGLEQPHTNEVLSCHQGNHENVHKL